MLVKFLSEKGCNIPKIISFGDIGWWYNWKVEFSMNFQIPVSFQPVRIGKDDSVKMLFLWPKKLTVEIYVQVLIKICGVIFF